MLMLFEQLYIVPDGALQATLLRDAYVAEICHGHGYEDEQLEDCVTPDLRGVVCRIRYVN